MIERAFPFAAPVSDAILAVIGFSPGNRIVLPAGLPMPIGGRGDARGLGGNTRRRGIAVRDIQSTCACGAMSAPIAGGGRRQTRQQRGSVR